MANNRRTSSPAIPPEVLARVKDHARSTERGRETDRTVFFSDAVFAIAMTLLALDLKLPEVAEGISNAEFNETLLHRIPELAAFVLSFVLVGRAWLSHHRHFKAIKGYDAGLQVRNLTMLFFVAFMPVPTAALFNSGPDTPWTPAIYALTLAGVNMSLRWTWSYAYKHQLTHEWLDEPLYKLMLRGADPVIAVLLLSIPVAFFSHNGSMYFWMLIWPASDIYGRIQRKRYERDEASLMMAADTVANRPDPGGPVSAP